jgi:hypothetical protein
MSANVARALADSRIDLDSLVGASMIRAAQTDRSLLPRMQVMFPAVWREVKDVALAPAPAARVATPATSRRRLMDRVRGALQMPLFRH